MKKIVAGVISIALLVSGSSAVSAIPLPPERTAITYGGIATAPFWQNVSLATATLSFNSGKGSLNGNVFGQPWVTSIKVNAVLERQNANGTYSHVNSWSNMISNSSAFNWNTTYNVTRGHTYRLTITATVTGNGLNETVTVSHSAIAS